MASTARVHAINQAEVEGFIAGYFGVSATTPGIADLTRVIFPGVHDAARRDPAGWRSVIPSVLANHIGLARGLGLQGSELQRQLEIMRASNRTSAEFVQARARVQALVAGMGGWRGVAAAAERGGGSGDQLSSLARAFEMNGGPYMADRLPTQMSRWVSTTYDAHHVAGVGNYLHNLGINAHQYTGFFVGSSDTVRHAIRDHVRNRTALTDEHVTNAADARAIIGAIQAGRIRLEDAPPSVRHLIEDMRSRGIDPSTADPGAIQRYFDQNPQALERARTLVLQEGATTSLTTGLNLESVRAQALAAGNITNLTGQLPPSGAQPPPPAIIVSPASSQPPPPEAPPPANQPPPPQTVVRTLG